MTKEMAATLGIWLASVTSAGALVYTLHRPLSPPTQPAGQREAASVLAAAPKNVVEPPSNAIELPPVEIAGSRLHAGARAARSAVGRRRWRDLSEMRCSGFRPLATGPVDQQVRYCE